ncbi:MAG: hypothetical protein GAK35_01890 [Herbaspirillum frisingense]|uniref:Type IV pilin protein n=1 Tax=Herbaspirillum frisingense TaxID=92645 RepID=A0A7V8FX61_9BURK|nr:MAG: hypothetical protein GAK35_01890 [Herbaspirillum frisingense]
MNKTLPRAPSHGFTLLELTAALAVVGLLAAIGWNSYSQYMLKARRAEGRAALLQVLIQQERQFSYQHRYQAFQPGAGETGFKWYSGETPSTIAYAIAAQACDGEDLSTCVRIIATPGGPAVNTAYRDEQCGILYADSRGRRGAAGGAACW